MEAGEIERFISQLENLPIHVDPLTSHQSFSRIMTLSRIYKLSSYDAVYLELAVREGLPLATLDKDLRKAAIKSNVEIYLKIRNCLHSIGSGKKGLDKYKCLFQVMTLQTHILK